ncbi:MAG: hypothetical protein ACPHUK_03780 [Candidatus Poseidoniaceae archaeon]
MSPLIIIWGNTVNALGELCSFVSGTGFPPEFQGRSEGDIPFIKVSDMISRGNEIKIIGSNNWVSTDDLPRFSKALVPEGSVVFAKIGLAIHKNRLRITTRPTIIDNNMMAAIPNEGVSTTELYAIISTINFPTWALGAALPYLRRADLSNISLSYINKESLKMLTPTLDKLIKIHDIESRKIENFDKLCLTLVTQLIEDSNTTGNHVPLRKVVAHKRESLNPQSCPKETLFHYSIPSFDNSELPEKTLASNILSNKFRLTEPCVLVSKLNPRIPRVWLPKLSREHISVCSTEFLPLIPKEPTMLNFLFYLFHTEKFLWYSTAYATGTTNSHQRINPKDVLNFPLPEFDRETILQFNTIASVAMKQKHSSLITRSVTKNRIKLILQGIIDS